jgi:hypothetical protein
MLVIGQRSDFSNWAAYSLFLIELVDLHRLIDMRRPEQANEVILKLPREVPDELSGVFAHDLHVADMAF